MDSTRAYHRLALRCIELAEAVEDPATRDQMVQLAEPCTRLGERAEALTLLMTLLIQRVEHRDTQAIHAKLDELLRGSGMAQNELASLYDKEPEGNVHESGNDLLPESFAMSQTMQWYRAEHLLQAHLRKRAS